MSQHPTNILLNDIIENTENIQLIWLDNTLCSNDIQTKLIELNSTILFFTDINQCIELIKSNEDEQIILIVSIILSENILSQIHSYSSLISVFIFSLNNEYKNQDLLKKYKKIIHIYSDYNLLIKSIERTINIIEQQIISFNIFNQNNNYKNDLSKDSSSFLWYQLIINILKQIPNNNNNNNLFDKYYQNELSQLKNFHIKTETIELYNKKNFIYKILNKSLRTKNIQLIYLLRNFIINLYEEIQIEKDNFHNKNQFILYYGQKILHTQLDKFTKYKDYYISPNGFLFASFNKTKSITLAKTGILSDEYEPVLFQIHINSTYKHMNFIEISNNEQLLFNIDTIFKINSIEFDSSLHLWIINLINDDSYFDYIQIYLQSIKNFTYDKSFFIFFGHLFIELDKLKQSEIYFYILYHSFSHDHEDFASIINQIGNFFADKGQLILALDYYQQSYEIRQKQLPHNHPHIANSLNNIGLIYKDQGNYDEALNYCQKALIIDEINYPNNHLYKAMTIENIGGIYKEKQLFSKAQTYLLRALNMYKYVLPTNHHVLIDILNSLGKVYCDQGYLDRALKCYQKALSICEINSLNDHLKKAQTIENIGLLYKTNGKLDKALKELLKAYDIYKRIYKNEHYDIARCLGHIGLVYEAMNDFNFALDYYNKQLNMDEKCLSSDHQNIQIDIQWIIDIYKKKGELLKAFEFCQKKFEEKKFLFGENHSITLNLLMLMIDLCNDPIMKSNYYKQALSIHENLIPFNSYEIIKCLDGMIKFYFKINNIQEALNYQIKMINLEREILTNDHIDLALSLQRLGQFYEALSNNDQAEKCYDESRIIFKKYENNNSNIKYSHMIYPLNTNLSYDKQESIVRKSNICILQ